MFKRLQNSFLYKFDCQSTNTNFKHCTGDNSQIDSTQEEVKECSENADQLKSFRLKRQLPPEEKAMDSTNEKDSKCGNKVNGKSNPKPAKFKLEVAESAGGQSHGLCAE